MLTQSLIQWYHANKRDLPWRKSSNPYHIWLSEVILQQTRVDQGLPYYEKILEACPDIFALASINKEAFFKLWQGLGYYRRAENILSTAKQIVVKNNGIFPNTYDSLIELKGIGPYTAAAVASIAFGEPKAVLDGNVYRVLARVFAVKTPTDGADGKKKFSALALEILDKNDPSSSNQALMELGALICTPKKPLCNQCPIKLWCNALTDENPESYPVRKKKTTASALFINFMIPVYKERIPIIQRNQNDIWRNLYEPPCIVSEKKQSDTWIISHLKKDWIIGNNLQITKAWETTHLLTHRKIYATFWVIKNAQLNKGIKGYKNVAIKHLSDYPVHRLFDKFLKKEYLALLCK